MDRPLQTVEKELLECVEQKRRERPELEYGQALKLVASERRDLDREYTRACRKVMGG